MSEPTDISGSSRSIVNLLDQQSAFKTKIIHFTYLHCHSIRGWHEHSTAGIVTPSRCWVPNDCWKWLWFLPLTISEALLSKWFIFFFCLFYSWMVAFLPHLLHYFIDTCINILTFFFTSDISFLSHLFFPQAYFFLFHFFFFFSYILSSNQFKICKEQRILHFLSGNL